MFCSQCGKQIPDGSSFCQFCGCKLQGTSPVQNTMNAPGRPAGMGSTADTSADRQRYAEAASTKKNGSFKKWLPISLIVVLTFLIAACVFIYKKRDGQSLMFDSKFDTPYRTYYWYDYDENGEICSDPSETGIENRYGFVLSFESADNWEYIYTYSDFKGKTRPASCVISCVYLEDESSEPGFVKCQYEYSGRMEKILMYNEAEELFYIRFIERDRKGEIIRDRIYNIFSISGSASVTDRKWENTYEKGRLQVVDISMDHYDLDNSDIESAGLDAVLPSDSFEYSNKAKMEYEY